MDLRPLVEEPEHGPARPDLDVVGVGAEEEEAERPVAAERGVEAEH